MKLHYCLLPEFPNFRYYLPLKGQCHEIFDSGFFMNQFPPSPEYPIRTVSNFFEKSRRYSQVQVHHRYQRHRWSTLSCEYLREFSKKFETALMVFSGTWGKPIHEKNQKSKISWHCSFKYVYM